MVRFRNIVEILYLSLSDSWFDRVRPRYTAPAKRVGGVNTARIPIVRMPSETEVINGKTQEIKLNLTSNCEGYNQKNGQDEIKDRMHVGLRRVFPKADGGVSCGGRSTRSTRFRWLAAVCCELQRATSWQRSEWPCRTALFRYSIGFVLSFKTGLGNKPGLLSTAGIPHQKAHGTHSAICLNSLGRSIRVGSNTLVWCSGDRVRRGDSLPTVD